MDNEKMKPLYTLCIGEFVELTKSIIAEIVNKHSEPQLASTVDETMTIDQCAQFLNCSKVSIHAYKKKGLPFYRIGRKILFKKSEVLDFIKFKPRTRR